MKSELIDQLHLAVRGKQHIIWDWNGTLLDDVGHAVSELNTFLEEH